MQFSAEQMQAAFRKSHSKCQCSHSAHGHRKSLRCDKALDWDSAVFVPDHAEKEALPLVYCRDCAKRHI